MIVQKRIRFVDLIKFELIHVVGELVIFRDAVNSRGYRWPPVKEGRERMCVIPVSGPSVSGIKLL